MNEITPAIFCKNEEYWIHYVLCDLLKVFPEVILLDTGSTDKTISIAKETEQKIGQGKLTLVENRYRNNRHLIGNSPNILRQMTMTYWMLLVAGDEIWKREELEKLISSELEVGMEVGMMLARNVIFQDGGFKERDSFNADRLFGPTVRWTKINHPYESHHLQRRIERRVVQYLPIHYWHVRHLDRSSHDSRVFYRSKKKGFYPYKGDLREIPASWLNLSDYPNPYLSEEYA